MLAVVLALLVIVLTVTPFAVAAALMSRAKARTGFEDELARLVDDTRWPGPSR